MTARAQVRNRNDCEAATNTARPTRTLSIVGGPTAKMHHPGVRFIRKRPRTAEESVGVPDLT
ncbi:hypothetical protein GCM10027456_44810 [Kineosporia babensis]